MSKSYDLSTSSKWASLSDGDHVVQLKAKGTGFGDSSFSNSVTVTKGSAMPSKGDIITLDSKQYRVLKVNGTVAEVLCMYDSVSSAELSLSNNVYADSIVDTYCNSTFYDTLSSNMKLAIADKTFTQDLWYADLDELSEPYYTGVLYPQIEEYIYYALTNAAYGSSITRHCYCLSVQDVIDYLGATVSMTPSDTTIIPANIKLLFGESSDADLNRALWLRSAVENATLYIIERDTGFMYPEQRQDIHAARPAFQIDLSKIEWTPVEGGDN